MLDRKFRYRTTASWVPNDRLGTQRPLPAADVALERDAVLRAHLHSDYPYGHATAFHGGKLTEVAPDWPWTMQLLWMLDDFTEESGPTADQTRDLH